MWIDSLFLTRLKANHPFNDFGTLLFKGWYNAELSADDLKVRCQILKRYKCSVLHWTKPAGPPAYLYRVHGVCFPPSIQPLPPRGPGATEAVGRSYCSTADFLRSQETFQICHVPVAVKSVLSSPPLSLLLAVAINLVEETSVMFESNFISSFINQVSAECLSPGEELCKRHGFFVLLLNWGRGNGERGDGWVCSLENRIRKKQLIFKIHLRLFFFFFSLRKFHASCFFLLCLITFSK